MSDGTIFVAKDSVLGELEGQPLYIHKGVTTVRAGHPLLAAFGDLFVPLRPTFEVEPEPVAALEPQSGAGAEPDPKAVRAWAADNSVAVSAKGKIPAEVNAAFLKASQGA